MRKYYLFYNDYAATVIEREYFQALNFQTSGAGKNIQLITHMATIDINKLEILINSLLNNLKAKGFTELAIDEDYYWNLPVEKMSAFPEQPELTVGSLIDDVHFLYSIIEEEYDPCFLDIERIASVLRFISAKVTFRA